MKLYINNNLFSFIKILNKKQLIDYNLLTKFNIYNFYLIPKLDKIVSTIVIDKNLKNETDITIITVVNLLDILLGKKSSIDNLMSKYIKRTKTIIFVNKSTITNWFQVYLLLFYLKYAIIPYLKRKHINLKFSITSEGFILNINDISSLDELPDNLKKEKISIKFSFFIKNNYCSDKLALLFLNFLGF
jgi:hypothetical protein